MPIYESPIFIEQIPLSPLGPLAAASTPRGVLAIEIGISNLTEWASRKGFSDGAVRFEAGPFPIAEQLSAYFAGRLRAFELPLDLEHRSDFQRRVLDAVMGIPYGATGTYGQIAAQIGRAGAYRAVGRANATNPLPIVIPCHRLVGADGSLRGYAAPGGVETKAWLLRFERL